MPQNHRLFLLDASSYLFRAYFAIGHLSNSKGIPTNATYGFTQMLLKLIKEEQPTHLVAVWDRPEPTFRKQAFEAYKAHREEMPADLPEQIGWIKKILEAMRIPALEKAGYEADDLIGTLARRMKEEGLEIVIVTGDKDLMQLVSDRIRLLDTMRDKWTDRNGVMERFGVGPEKVVEVLGLAGDASDNIPGVPGIGEKTASTLIQQFGSIDELYRRLDEIKGKRREILEKNKEAALLSRKLVTIDTDVPLECRLEDFRLQEPDSAGLYSIFRELEFSRLLSQIEQPKTLDTRHYECVDSEEKLAALCGELKKTPHFSFDTETTSLNPLLAELVGISFATGEGRAFYIPIGHQKAGDRRQEIGDRREEDGKEASEIRQLELKKVLESLKPILEDPSRLKIAQNFKYDYQILKKAGVEVKGLHCDTMIAAYLLEPSGSHNLDFLAQEHLQHKTISYAEVTGGKKGTSFAEVPIEKAVEYSGEDAEVAFRLAEILLPRLKEENLEGLFRGIELPLVPILADMELAGIKIDRPFLSELQKEFEERIRAAEKKIHLLAGETFNINSTKQLGQILFEKLQLPVQRKTKTGYSTDVDVLTELAKLHDLPKEILSYRSLAKLKSTYVDALLVLADPKTDRVHTSFNQTVAETGRLSSSDPNLQNIPIRTDDGKKIRQAFVADEGFQLLSADYSQIELRVLAHLAEDPSLLKAFQNEEDVHRLTAASIFGLDPAEISPSMRSIGKTVNFAVIYGQTPFGLSGQLGISPAKAREYIDNYFAQYRKVAAYREKILAEAREREVVYTLYGRRRRVPDIRSKNPNVRSLAERIAFNTVIQGTAADLIKLAMIRIDRQLRERDLESRMLLQVHDELVFEAADPEIEAVKQLVKAQMEGVAELKIPIKVEIGIGSHWGEAH